MKGIKEAIEGIILYALIVITSMYGTYYPLAPRLFASRVRFCGLCPHTTHLLQQRKLWIAEKPAIRSKVRPKQGRGR